MGMITIKDPFKGLGDQIKSKLPQEPQYDNLESIVDSMSITEKQKLEDRFGYYNVGLTTLDETVDSVADSLYAKVNEGPQTISVFEPTQKVNYGSFEETLDALDAQEAIENFSDGAYYEIARGFRKTRVEDEGYAAQVSDDIEGLKRVFKALGDYSGISHRGTSLDIDKFKELNEGDFLVTKAPSSSSKSLGIAEEFAMDNMNTRNVKEDLKYGYKVPVVYTIDNKYNYQYNLANVAIHSSEKEVLIAPNSLFQIDEIIDATDSAGNKYKQVKLTSTFNDPELLAMIKERSPNTPINDKVLGFGALALALGATQEQAEASPIMQTVLGGTVAAKAQGGFDPYSDEEILRQAGIEKDQRNDVQQTYFDALKFASGKGVFELAATKNILSAAHTFATAKEFTFDGDWVATGREEWLKEVESSMSPSMLESIKEQISEGKLTSKDEMLQAVRYHAEEEALATKMYEDGFLAPFAADVVTGAFQPSDLALTIATLGAYKVAKAPIQAARAWSTKKKIAATALATGGFSVASEEGRQYLAGIDLNDTAFTAAFGTILGGSFSGLRYGWQRMTNAEQGETIQAANNYAENYFRWTEQPQATAYENGVPKVPGVSTRWNPSPLITVYGQGKDYLYEFADKIAPSFVTLYDGAGNPVTQTTKSAWQITDHWIDSHYKTYETKIQTLQKDSGMKSDEFNGAVTLAARQQAELYKAKKFKIEVLTDRIKNTEDEATKILLSNELEIVKAETVEQLQFDNPAVAKAVTLTNKFFGDYNAKFKELERNRRIKDLDEQNNLDTYAEDLARIEEEVNLKYDGRENAYFSRFWDKDVVATDPNAATKIANAIRNSSQLEAYRLYDPDKYDELYNSADEIASNMVEKIRNATANLELDILPSTRQGQGDVTKAKSDIARKIDVLDEGVMDLTKSDLTEVTHAYAHDNAHKIGIREALGVKDKQELIDKYLNPLVEKLNADTTISQRDKEEIIRDLDVVIDTAAGTRHLATDPNGSLQLFKRAITGINNAWYSAGMGEMTLSEIGTGWKVAGRDFLRELIPGFKKVVADYRKKAYTPEEIEDMQDALDGIALGTSVVHSNLERRYGDGSIYRFNENDSFAQKATENINKVANAGFHIGGMNAISTTIQYATAMGLMKRVHRLGSKLREGGRLSKAQKASFARWGLTEEDMKFISMQRLYDEDGNPNFNMTGWDEGMKEKMLRVTWSGAKEAVLVDNPYALPKPFTDPGSLGAVTQILGQYSKHPIMSYNALFKNGWNDKDARTVASAGFSFGLLANAIYLREQLAIQAGWLDEADAEYDVDTEEGLIKLLLKVAMTVPHLFYLSKFADFSSMMTAGTTFGTDYIVDPRTSLSGTAGGAMKKIYDVTTGTEIDFEYPEDSFLSPKVLRLLPIVGSHPATDYFIKDLENKIDSEGWID